MALNFTQSGYDLEIDTTTSEVPPQFTRGGLCSVQLTDDTFDGLDKMALLFAPDDGRRHAPAVVELSKTDSGGMHYSGAFTRASMLNDGPVLVALAGTTSKQTITSNAYRITVEKSLDPEVGMLADPATLADVVAAAVDSWLQANGIPTDSTLSVAGKPADAAATGERLSQLTEEIVNPVEKTVEMTQPVGVDDDGRLWTAPVNGTTAEEPNYEQVGVAPYAVTESGLFVLPDAETRIYTEGGRENLLANIQNVVDGPWGLTSIDYTVSGNTVTVNSVEIGSGLWAMFTIYGIYLEPGDYTFQVQGCTGIATDLHSGTSADDSEWNNSHDIVSNLRGEEIWNFTVTEGKYLKISPKKLNNSTWPVTLKFFLVAGTYDTIPDATVSLSFTVAAGEKFSLDAFNGTTMYSDPDGVSVYRPVEDAAPDNEIVICFGDSIMTYCKVPAALNDLGINAVDMAVSGACLFGGRDVNTHPYDMCHIVDALETGDLTAQINGGSQPNFESLLSLMPSTTTLLIEFGTNDFQGLVALEGEDKTSITGGLRYVLSKLCTMYPEKKIVVISTLGWTLAGNTNDISLTLEQLNDALRNVASEYNIPFIDALHGVGLNTYTRNALTTDGCHLNAVGVKRYSKFLSGQLSALGI